MKLWRIIKWFFTERQPYGVRYSKYISRRANGVTKWRKWDRGDYIPRTLQAAIDNLPRKIWPISENALQRLSERVKKSIIREEK